MMGCALFAYLCANVGVKLYLRQLNQAVVNASEESTRKFCARCLCKRWIWKICTRLFRGCSLFTFFCTWRTRRLLAFYILLHSSWRTRRLLAFYILLLVCLGGVKVFVILCESERVYACARKILVSVSSLSLPVTFSPLSEIRNSMDSSWLCQQHEKMQFQISKLSRSFCSGAVWQIGSTLRCQEFQERIHSNSPHPFSTTHPHNVQHISLSREGTPPLSRSHTHTNERQT